MYSLELRNSYFPMQKCLKILLSVSWLLYGNQRPQAIRNYGGLLRCAARQYESTSYHLSILLTLADFFTSSW